MAKAWDIEPSIFAGMIEEDVGLKIRYIAMQILTAIDIAAPVDTGRFRNNNLVSLQHPDFGISDNVDPNGTIAVQRGIGVISKAANYGVIYIQNNLPYAEALENGHSQQAPTGVYANVIKGEPVDSAGKLRYSFKEVSAVSLNGVAGGNGFCIDSFDIQFDNKLQTQRCIGTGSPYAGANIPTTFTPSGTVTLSWSKAAWEIWSKTLTGETVPFSFTLSNGEGAYTFSFPKVQVSGEWPDGGNSDIIQVQLSITAADEAPTITRKKIPRLP